MLMAVTRDDLAAFHQFAEAKLAILGPESLHELVDIWEIEHPAPDRLADDAAAVRAAIRDMELGESGQPARRVMEELRTELGS
jgi:hypothetical protein